MKLSENTIKILQNFATINPNIVVNANEKVLKTVSEAKNIMASATTEDVFDCSFGIYDLNEFLSAINLINIPTFNVDSAKINVKGGDGKHSLNYFCANPEILTYPKKTIQDPNYEVEFTLTLANVMSLKKAASVLGFDTFSLTKESGKYDIVGSVSDLSNKSSNAYKLTVGECKDDSEFSFDFSINNLKMIPNDYVVSLSSKLISRWAPSKDTSSFTTPPPKITYWIALETTSNYTNN